ncbi:MAG TPA: glycosyltransferase family 2 protein [Pirellulaceae bacterium]|nr:glycosyltransferase family 2 protein [Planctomycetales bacterium]HRX79291.1 glycosyltransferase family 2 protein [Pirellulaceae bacterium]
MNSFSADDEVSTDALREVVLRLADELQSQDVEGIPSERVELLERVIGRDACRRLGIYALPPDFILSVVIPVYNEANTLERVIARVRETHLPMEIICVDDGSKDGTREVLERLAAEQNIKAVFHERNQGKGAALRTGFIEATGDIVVVQDADMEYDPQDLRLLLQPILDGGADVVYGSRFSGPDRAVSPLWHLAANKLITNLFNIFHGHRFTDVETCYKLFRRELIQEVAPKLREKRFGIELEMTARLLKNRNVRFHERPIRYERRSYAEGKKIGWRDGLWALWCIVRY